MRRAYGTSGIEVSVLGFGGGHVGDACLTERDAERVLRGAVELGVTFFDTAPSYGLSEERFGRHLADLDVVISTKGGYGVTGVPDWTGEVITRGVDRALGVLRRARVDVLHLHSCPLETLAREDVLRALDDARAAGKIGVAAYSGDNEALAWAVSSGRFGGVQCSVNLFDQRALGEVLPDASRRGLGVVAKRPLANAPWRHAERPHGAYVEPYWERMRAMDVAPADGDWATTALRFAAYAPGVTAVIAGSRDLAHVAANAEAVARGPLSDVEVRRFRDAFCARDQGWIGQT